MTEDAADVREHLITYPLHENKNSLRCTSCGKWLYMPGKEYLPVSLDYCRMVKGIPLCTGCAWELEPDLENEEYVQKLRKKRENGFDGENLSNDLMGRERLIRVPKDDIFR